MVLLTSVYLIERKHDTNLILLTELSHETIKAWIVQFVWPYPDQNATCDRTHLFKIGSESLHTSNTRINKAYKELIKKGIIKIIKESGFRGTSKHEIIINENDTAIQLQAIQKRIAYFEKAGKKHFPNMFKEDFMLNNFEVKNDKLVGYLNVPYSINPKYQNDFDFYCFQMHSLFNDVSLLAVSLSNGCIVKEYDYMVRNFTISAVNVVMKSIQNRLDKHGEYKLTPKSDYNMRKRWELLIQFRTRLTWLLQIEKKDNRLVLNPQLNDMWKDGPALKLTADEKKYCKKYKNWLKMKA